MSHVVVRNLRLHLFTAIRREIVNRATSSKTCLFRSIASQPSGKKDVTNDFEKRVSQLKDLRGLDQCYPRLPCGYNNAQFNGLKALRAAKRLDASVPLDNAAEDPISVAGRVISVRTAGSKLMFFDIKLQPIEEDAEALDGIQGVCRFSDLGSTGLTIEQFKHIPKILRKGDWVMFVGRPHRTNSGQLSLLLDRAPQLLAPSLHQVPSTLEDPEVRMRKRHVDMLVNPDAVRALRIRHEVEAAFHQFFSQRGFTKVSTPLLSAQAGGAVARPFVTKATELAADELFLRIAPELWLKRLVVGGMERVYEIGPAFRNEGVDATHNPEFSICEFYQAFATLEDLMGQTEALFRNVYESVQPKDSSLATLFGAPFSRIDFLPEMERLLGKRLPDLQQPNALKALVDICEQHQIVIPSNATLPGLLDAMAASILEPHCQDPTFIMNHPACMSPLSKHYVCPTTGQMIAARAELFIRNREFANMYEEENSPFEQRRKFLEQLAFRQVDGEDGGRSKLDESYLETLEWGLPPTGGWGCGMDRLVMLFSGQERIADVLSFGTLRNVVGLSRGNFS